MNEETTVKLAEYTGQKVFKHHCPECGHKMFEVERTNENGFIFIWYECARVGCSGQWLEKRLLGSSSFTISATRPAHVFGII
jgi:predicted RNA-binding Zn-ribbon protein involved in translation (DUF1610 family)